MVLNKVTQNWKMDQTEIHSQKRMERMRHANRTVKIFAAVLALAFMAGCLPTAAVAQDQAPYFPPEQLDRLVSRIALYPDPLLAQILAGATFPDQIPDAARWADEHHYLRGEQLADAINSDHLPFDPSVQALLPFPNVLDEMANDMNWTSDLGSAFLAQRNDVMDAVQRERHRAYEYGYLRSNPQVVVTGGPYIAITPVNPGYVVVPYYDPGVVFVAPRPGFFVGGAIRFGFGITIGAAFRPWGWGYNRFDWGRRAVIINDHPWGREWANRRVYVHPYEGPRRWEGNRPEDHHELIRRDEHEKNAWREGHGREDEHHGRGHDRDDHRPH